MGGFISEAEEAIRLLKEELDRKNKEIEELKSRLRTNTRRNTGNAEFRRYLNELTP